jgi:hypothetical protein
MHPISQYQIQESNSGTPFAVSASNDPISPFKGGASIALGKAERKFKLLNLLPFT